MKFKGITCLTKANKKKSETERNENQIFFNESKIEIMENIFSLSLKDREVLFIGNSVSVKDSDYRSIRPTYIVNVNWVKCFKNCDSCYEIPEDATDILIITSEIFNVLLDKGYSEMEIYTLFKTKGLGQMSMDLPEVNDFTALTSLIIKE